MRFRNQPNPFLHASSVVGQSRFQHWRDALRFVDVTKIMVHEVHSYGVPVILDFVAEPLCESREGRHRRERR